jgi:arylsulfatase A-like enzyme
MKLTRAILLLLLLLSLSQSGDDGVPVFAADLLPDAGGPGLLIGTDTADPECLGCSVILISIDTLRADHLGCYGYPRETSPNIDRLAAESVVFRNAIAQAPSTVRSHASILTSLFNFQHQARFSPMTPLPDEAVTITEVLSQQGYQTAAFTGSGQTHPEYGLGQGFDLYDDRDQRKFGEAVEDAIDWLEAEPRGKFFLFLHTYEVHSPYTPAQEHLDLFPPEPESSLPEQISVDLLQQMRREFFGRVYFSPADVRQVIRSYDAEIRSVDEGLGRLLDYLRARRELDDLLIVFTADHGEEFGEHGTLGRHSHALYDEILRVPLVIKLPRGAFASRSVWTQVRSIDIAPTITDVLAIDAPPSFQGVSLVDRAAGRSRESLIAISERGRDKPEIAVRTERWKLYDDKLFDLLADPGQETDVSSRYSTVRLALEMALGNTISAGTVLDSESVTPSEEILRQLKALGYVQ